MFDFTDIFKEGLISGLLLGFDLLWKTFTEHPMLLIFFAFLIVGNVTVKKMNKHHYRH